jgi:hypothetical protein
LSADLVFVQTWTHSLGNNEEDENDPELDDLETPWSKSNAKKHLKIKNYCWYGSWVKAKGSVSDE